MDPRLVQGRCGEDGSLWGWDIDIDPLSPIFMVQSKMAVLEKVTTIWWHPSFHWTMSMGGRVRFGRYVRSLDFSGQFFSEVFLGEKFQGAKSLSSWAWSVIGRFYYILVVKNPTYKSMPEVIEQYFQWVGWWSWCSGWFHVNIALFL